MDQQDVEQKIEELVRRDPRYRHDAYPFVANAVTFTVGRLPKHRHVSALELLHGVRDYAQKEFGVLAQQVLDELIANGQVATQYVDLEGQPTMDQRYNPNGSVLAIEGITSPDGRVFGKMGHSERSGQYLYKNVTGDKYQPIFEGGVDYFKI